MLNYKQIWHGTKPTNDWINSTLQSVYPSPARVRCWCLLTWLYVRICDMCICHTVLWSNICMCFQMILRFDYICIKWFIIFFGIITFEIIEWVCEKSKYSSLLDSILLCIMYNCLLDVWLNPSITIFRLNFNWETEILDLFVRCKVECGSF